jgi:hypothetical protein
VSRVTKLEGLIKRKPRTQQHGYGTDLVLLAMMTVDVGAGTGSGVQW